MDTSPLVAARSPALTPYAASVTTTSTRPSSSASRRRREAGMESPGLILQVRPESHRGHGIFLPPIRAEASLLEDDLDATVLRATLGGRVARDGIRSPVPAPRDAPPPSPPPRP